MLCRLRALLMGTLAAVILLVWSSQSAGSTERVKGKHAQAVAVAQKRARVVAVAKRYLGVPYVYGAAGPYSFDCSGLTRFVYLKVGISLPHNAAAQFYSTRRVNRLRRGDLVFPHGLGHVGIYIGARKYIHSPHSGALVRIGQLDGGYVSAGRVIPR